MQKNESISKIRNRFKKEWLLIHIEETNPSTLEPVSGKLLMHSPRKDEVERKARSVRGHILVIHSTPGLSKGYAAAF